MARIVICTQGGIDDKKLLRAIRGITDVVEEWKWMDTPT
jgi:hypothetical protein